MTKDEARALFEKTVTTPPFERSVRRYPDTPQQAWPGNYRDYGIDFAWSVFVLALEDAGLIQ